MSGYTSVEIPANVPGIGYTLRHRQAVEELIKYYCKKAIGHVDGNGVVFTQDDYVIMVNRGKCHDMDKVVCGLSYPQLTVDYFHRLFNGHHAENCMNSLNKYDAIEMIFDWESARYTKPDKGKCAFEVATTFNSRLLEYVKPYLELFGFTKVSTELVPAVVSKLKPKFYEEDLIEAILSYIHTTHIHLMEGISRIDDEGYMKLFNAPAPFRHQNTQRIGGTVHQRPNQYVSTGSNFLKSHEMIEGVLQAQVFDYDAICKVPVSSIPALNKQCLSCYNKMLENGCTR